MPESLVSGPGTLAGWHRGRTRSGGSIAPRGRTAELQGRPQRLSFPPSARTRKPPAAVVAGWGRVALGATRALGRHHEAASLVLEDLHSPHRLACTPRHTLEGPAPRQTVRRRPRSWPWVPGLVCDPELVERVPQVLGALQPPCSEQGEALGRHVSHGPAGRGDFRHLRLYTRAQLSAWPGAVTGQALSGLASDPLLILTEVLGGGAILGLCHRTRVGTRARRALRREQTDGGSCVSGLRQALPREGTGFTRTTQPASDPGQPGPRRPRAPPTPLHSPLGSGDAAGLPVPHRPRGATRHLSRTVQKAIAASSPGQTAEGPPSLNPSAGRH